MMIKRRFTALLLTILGLAMVFGTSAINAQDSLSLFETMTRKGPLKITITTNQKKLIREKEKEEYQPALLTYQDLAGNTVERDIQVKTRGNMRLKTCYYPPIRIKISDADIESEGLKRYSKLKLVATCKPGEDYQQMVLREYLAYKIRNIIDDYGFRVQLVSLRMEDSEGKQKPREVLAFVIEDEDEMAARLGGSIYDPRSVSRRALHQEAYAMLSIFQYLIGNTDWFVLNKHNTKFIRSEDPPSIIPIAYDFDFAGLVNAPYALPNEKMPIASVQDRFFLGDCGVEGQYDEVIKKLSSKKSEIFALIENCTYLNDRSRNDLIKYLTKSFEILEDPKYLAKEIKRGCGWSPINN